MHHGKIGVMAQYYIRYTFECITLNKIVNKSGQKSNDAIQHTSVA